MLEVRKVLADLLLVMSLGGSAASALLGLSILLLQASGCAGGACIMNCQGGCPDKRPVPGGFTCDQAVACQAKPGTMALCSCQMWEERGNVRCICAE